MVFRTRNHAPASDTTFQKHTGLSSRTEMSAQISNFCRVLLPSTVGNSATFHRRHRRWMRNPDRLRCWAIGSKIVCARRGFWSNGAPKVGRSSAIEPRANDFDCEGYKARSAPSSASQNGDESPLLAVAGNGENGAGKAHLSALALRPVKLLRLHLSAETILNTEAHGKGSCPE
jgi:hypothetical protein